MDLKKLKDKSERKLLIKLGVVAIFILFLAYFLGASRADASKKKADELYHVCWYSQVSPDGNGGAAGISRDREEANKIGKETCEKHYGKCKFDYCYVKKEETNNGKER